MSTQLQKIKAIKGDITITQFSGPTFVGPMLQVTQESYGNSGYVQFTLEETASIVNILVGWIKDESRRRAELLKKKIEEDKSLERTMFKDVADCERFIAEFEVPALCVGSLSKVVIC